MEELQITTPGSPPRALASTANFSINSRSDVPVHDWSVSPTHATEEFEGSTPSPPSSPRNLKIKYRDQGLPEASESAMESHGAAITHPAAVEADPVFECLGSRLIHPDTDSKPKPSPTNQTGFTSLPPEIRHRIFEYALLAGLGQPGRFKSRDGLDSYIQRTSRHTYKHDQLHGAAYALFSTRASTPQVAAEAREIFHYKNKCMVQLNSNEIDGFLANEVWSAARKQCQYFDIQTALSWPTGSSTLEAELRPLLQCPRLREVLISRESTNHRRENRIPCLEEELTLLLEASEELHKRLGDGLSFDLNIEFIVLPDNTQWDVPIYPWRSSYDMVEQLRDLLARDMGSMSKLSWFFLDVMGDEYF